MYEYEYALSHARFALRGSPSIRQYYMQTISKCSILLFLSSYSGSFISHFLQIFCRVSIRYSKFLWKGILQFLVIFLKWLKKVIAFFIIFTSSGQFHPSKRLIIRKRMNIKKTRKKGNLGAKGEKHKEQLRHGFP